MVHVDSGTMPNVGMNTEIETAALCKESSASPTTGHGIGSYFFGCIFESDSGCERYKVIYLIWEITLKEIAKMLRADSICVVTFYAIFFSRMALSYKAVTRKSR